ncbi:MAG: hypothetical protein ACREX7_09040, partial [Casimicrobiaceae bacterium]
MPIVVTYAAELASTGRESTATFQTLSRGNIGRTVNIADASAAPMPATANPMATKVRHVLRCISFSGGRSDPI